MSLLQRKRKCFFILVFCGFVLILVYISLGIIYEKELCIGMRCLYNKKKYSRNPSLICRLPKFDPFEESVIKLLPTASQVPTTVCPRVEEYFELVDGRIQPRDGELASNILKRSVKYEIIKRPEDGTDDFSVGSEVFLYKRGRKLQDIQSDFVKVSYRLEDKTRKVEILAQIAPKIDKPRHRVGEDDLNVVLLGFDSTSNANFQRELPRSYKYLRKKLGAFIFSGYSVIGDGTTPALAAMLTGIPLRVVQGNTSNLDHWPWIMKDFKKQGYVTLYAEDDPQLACFNSFRRGGFAQSPADHYARPFWLAVEQYGSDGRKRNKSEMLHRICFQSEPLHSITLDYTTKFLDAYTKTPKFAFSYFSYLPHGTGQNLRYAEDDLVKFLKHFQKFRESSILIIFGDHGARIGPLRNTIQGNHEEHLPWLSIVTPSWFKDKYPNIVESLEINRNIITTPFDVHHTLHHILDLEKKPAPGTSLFAPLSVRRSCYDAGVDEHWCPCMNWEKIDISHPHVNAAAGIMIKQINKVLSRKQVYIQLCFTIYLADILTATRATNGAMSDTYYSVTIATNPGGGTFQGTFYRDFHGNLIMNPHMSRTNIYGRNPWCLPQQHRSLRKFCTCRKEYRARHDIE